MSYHSSRFIRAINFLLCCQLIDLEPAELAIKVGIVPVAADFLDQAILANAEQKDMLQVVVETLIGNRSVGFGLGSGDHDLCCYISFVIGDNGCHLICQVGEGIDKCCPESLPDRVHFSVTTNHTLPGPNFERNVVEVGILRAKLDHSLEIVHPVSLEEGG